MNDDITYFEVNSQRADKQVHKPPERIAFAYLSFYHRSVYTPAVKLNYANI